MLWWAVCRYFFSLSFPFYSNIFSETFVCMNNKYLHKRTKNLISYGSIKEGKKRRRRRKPILLERTCIDDLLFCFRINYLYWSVGSCLIIILLTDWYIYMSTLNVTIFLDGGWVGTKFHFTLCSWKSETSSSLDVGRFDCNNRVVRCRSDWLSLVKFFAIERSSSTRFCDIASLFV